MNFRIVSFHHDTGILVVYTTDDLAPLLRPQPKGVAHLVDGHLIPPGQVVISEPPLRRKAPST